MEYSKPMFVIRGYCSWALAGFMARHPKPPCLAHWERPTYFRLAFISNVFNEGLFRTFSLKLILKIHGFLSEGRRILKRMELLWSAKCQQTPHHSLETLFVLCTLHGWPQRKSKLIFTPYFHLSFSFSLLHNFFLLTLTLWKPLCSVRTF